MKRRVLIIFCAMLYFSPFAVAELEFDARVRFDQAMTYFSQGNYEQATIRLRQVTESPAAQDLHPDAFYWLGRARLAQNDSFEAIRYFDHLIRVYPDHPRVPDATYHRARAEFIAQDYQDALLGFESFIREYPQSPYVANAYYWAGEALLTLGHRERARSLFETVVVNYPNSFRVEAAQYRMSLIALGEREEQLQRLLQWSHEEHLRTIESFRRAQSAWMDAIAAYRDAAEGTLHGSAAEIAALRAQIAELLTRIAQSHADVPGVYPDRSAPPTAESDLAARLHLAELKEAALLIKEQLLREIASDSSGTGR
jgi:TolA-binding protein